MWLFNVVFVSAAICSIVYAFFKHRFQYWKKLGIPYFPPQIPSGNFAILNRTKSSREIFGEIYQQFKGQAPYAGLYFFFKPMPLATDLDFIHHILVKDFQKFQNRGTYYNKEVDPLSAHIFSLDGNEWKRLRMKLTPTFTSGKMKFMFPTMVEVSDRFDKILTEMLKIESIIEIKELLARFTTDIIGTCAFGIECNSLEDRNTEFQKYGNMFFDSPNLGIWKRGFVNGFPNLARKFGLRTMQKELSDFFMNVVKQNVAHREKNNIRRNDFMDLLIQLKNGDDKDGYGKLSIEEIAAQAFLFFLAGFETASTAMTFSLYELTLNQELQEKARQEIRDVLQKHNGQFTYEAMMEMHLLDRIISESIRKYPPVFFLFRVVNEDFPIPGTDKILPKNSRIFIPIYSIHNDPDIYPNPELFDPNRFTKEECSKRHPMAFLGFGNGPRNCIGSRFGQMQSRIGLVKLLKNYRFKTCDKTTIPIKLAPQSISLAPEGGMFLSVERIA